MAGIKALRAVAAGAASRRAVNGRSSPTAKQAAAPECRSRSSEGLSNSARPAHSHSVGEQVSDSAGRINSRILPVMATVLIALVAVFFVGMGLSGLVVPAALIQPFGIALTGPEARTEAVAASLLVIAAAG